MMYPMVVVENIYISIVFAQTRTMIEKWNLHTTIAETDGIQTIRSDWTLYLGRLTLSK